MGEIRAEPFKPLIPQRYFESIGVNAAGCGATMK
jgi:hypothetical protein